MKTIYIIRGLPGSGKSTLANKLAFCVCEADQFFIGNDGVYRYDREKIGLAHKFCQDKVKEAMAYSIQNIAVSNTFVKRWEFQPYVALAQTYGYRIVEISLTGDTYANLHSVPEEVIAKMRENWEH